MVTPSGILDAGMVVPLGAAGFAAGVLLAGLLATGLGVVGFAGAAFAAVLVAGAAAFAAGFAATLLAAGAAFATGSFAGVALAAGTFTLCMDGPFFSSAAGALTAASFLSYYVFLLLNNAIIDLHESKKIL